MSACRTVLRAQVILVAVLLSACMQTGMSSKQADELLAEVRGLRKDVAALGDSLKTAPAPRAGTAPAQRAAASVSIEGAYSLGDPKAPVVLVEFTDLQCPYCRRHHLTVWPEIKKAYVDTGKVRYVIKDLPLPMHPYAQGAAQAARCVGSLGGPDAYWKMVDGLFAKSPGLEPAANAALAADLKVDAAAFAQCMQSGQFRAAIGQDSAAAAAIGVTGTPAFIVGRVGGTAASGSLLMGAQPFPAFQQALDAALAGTGEPR